MSTAQYVWGVAGPPKTDSSDDIILAETSQTLSKFQFKGWFKCETLALPRTKSVLKTPSPNTTCGLYQWDLAKQGRQSAGQTRPGLPLPLDSDPNIDLPNSESYRQESTKRPALLKLFVFKKWIYLTFFFLAKGFILFYLFI